ncbi:MAG: hypothetical protein HYX36_07275 [Rhizobiales bacterium]|nr:hypothetical protein [Hyphomicrobiales bacterium]
MSTRLRPTGSPSCSIGLVSLKPAAGSACSISAPTRKARYLENTGGAIVFDTFAEIWCELAAKGKISRAEFERTNFPQHYWTVEEFTAPLTDVAGSLFAAGLRLEQTDTRVVACPHASDFLSHGNASRFAHEYLPTFRSQSETVFAIGLEPARPLEQHAGIVDELYQCYVQKAANGPQGKGMTYISILSSAR